MSDKPDASREPAASHQLEASREPAGSHQLEASREPAASHQLEASREPAASRQPAASHPLEASVRVRERGGAGRERALGALRAAIRGGDLAPGQRLIEGEIAEQLGVTRASVRVALLDLAADGLVERIPNRGARVRPVSLAEAVQITECRMMLEGLCAAKAAEHATGEQIGFLADLGVRLRAAVEAGEPLKYSQLNSELHRYVQVMSGQDIAMGLLDRLNAQLVRHQFRLALQPGRSQVSLGEHLEIIEAVRARDPVRAEQAARTHLLSVITALTAVDSQPSQPMKQLHNVR